MDKYFDNVASLVEDVAETNSQRVVIVSHSMGGPVTQSFLNAKSQSWKDKHIAAWFPIAGAFTGVPRVAKSLISGDNFGISFVHADQLKEIADTLESMYFLLPLPGVWPDNLVTVNSSPKNTIYGPVISDYIALLKALDISGPEARVNTLMERRIAMKAPNVPVYCIYGTGIDTTPYRFEYDALDGSLPTKQMNGTGDGTVPTPSSTHCKTWKQDQPVLLKRFDGLEHVDAVKKIQVFEYIQDIMEALLQSSASTAHTEL